MTRTSLLALLLLAGCQPFSDLEAARGEARFIPSEVVGTLGLAVAQSDQFAAWGAAVQEAAFVGVPAAESCAVVTALDAVGEDGAGSVSFRVDECPELRGLIHVSHDLGALELPPEDSGEAPRGARDDDGGDVGGGDDEPPDGGGPDGSPGGGPDAPGSDGTLFGHGDQTTRVRFDGYQLMGVIDLKGEVGVSGDAGGGAVEALVGIAALEYRGLADVAGVWSRRLEGDGRALSFGGDFISTTGVRWSVVADNLVVQNGCLDSTAGSFRAVFDNDVGRTEVEATFDDLCDGCAQVTVDGVDYGTACFLGNDWIGPASEQ